jgi:hypothetical protein
MYIKYTHYTTCMSTHSFIVGLRMIKLYNKLRASLFSFSARAGRGGHRERLLSLHSRLHIHIHTHIYTHTCAHAHVHGTTVRRAVQAAKSDSRNIQPSAQRDMYSKGYPEYQQLPTHMFYLGSIRSWARKCARTARFGFRRCPIC